MSTRSSSDDTREAILRAAGTMFAEEGVDHVALHRIGAAAGQQNRTAVQYHFGNREGLLVALLDRHEPGIAAHRNTIVDGIEAEGATSDPTRLAEAFVLPLATKAHDPDGGLDYIRTASQLVGHPRFSMFRLEQLREHPAPRRLDRIAAGRGRRARPETVLPVMITATGLAYHGIADWSRVAEAELGGLTPQSWDALVDHLVHAVAGVFAYRAGTVPRRDYRALDGIELEDAWRS